MEQYVIGKIIAYRIKFNRPVPNRVLLSMVQTDPNSPFKPQTIHRELIDVLHRLQDKGYVEVTKDGWSSWYPSNPKVEEKKDA